MARKVFISFLGTSYYESGKYRRDSFVSDSTNFIQVASLMYLNSIEPWTSEDQAYILLTDKAKRTNWLDNGVKHRETGESYLGLKTRLEQLNLPLKMDIIEDIPHGNDEKEILEIFTRLFEVLQDGDELYFDVTHGFRSLPMLALVMGNYAKFLKNGLKVKSITYGNWEARQGIVAPIINLQVLSVLQDWSFAAADYIENGNAIRLQELVNTNSDSSISKSLVNDLAAFCDDALTCRGMNIGMSRTINKIIRKLKKVSEKDSTALNPIIQKIREHFEPFEISKPQKFSIKNGFEAAKWCVNHGMYQQAATILEENIVSYFCDKYDIPFNDEYRRPRINKAMIISKRNLSEGEWKVDSETEKNHLRNILQNSIFNRTIIANKFHELTTLRNDINHDGMRGNPKSANKFKKDIGKLIGYFERILR